MQPSKLSLISAFAVAASAVILPGVPLPLSVAGVPVPAVPSRSFLSTGFPTRARLITRSTIASALPTVPTPGLPNPPAVPVPVTGVPNLPAVPTSAIPNLPAATGVKIPDVPGLPSLPAVDVPAVGDLPVPALPLPGVPDPKDLISRITQVIQILQIITALLSGITIPGLGALGVGSALIPLLIKTAAGLLKI